jgi:hypothetical protein
MNSWAAHYASSTISASPSRRESYSSASLYELSKLSISTAPTSTTSSVTSSPTHSPIVSGSALSDHQHQLALLESQRFPPKRTPSISSSSTTSNRRRGPSPDKPEGVKKNKVEKFVKEKCRRRVQTRQIITLLDGLEADGVRFNKKDQLTSRNHKTSKGLKQTKIVTLAQHTIVSREKGRRLKCLPNCIDQIETAISLIESNPARTVEMLTHLQSGLGDLANAPFIISDEELKVYTGLTAEELAEIDPSTSNMY